LSISEEAKSLLVDGAKLEQAMEEKKSGESVYVW
jgi:hypothetical protein